MTPAPPAKAPRRRLPRAERREQLLGAARAVFAAQGFDAATFEEIADRAGITRPILYSHFGDKQTLFEAVVTTEARRVQSVVVAALEAEGEPRELLERGLHAFFGYVREHPDGHAVLMLDAPLGPAGLGAMVDELGENISKVIRRRLLDHGLAPEKAPVYAHTLIGVAAQVGRWWRNHPAMPLEEVADEVSRLMWIGFSGIAEGAR